MLCGVRVKCATEGCASCMQQQHYAATVVHWQQAVWVSFPWWGGGGGLYGLTQRAHRVAPRLRDTARAGKSAFSAADVSVACAQAKAEHAEEAKKVGVRNDA